MNNKEEWKKILEKYESPEIQQYLVGIYDELQRHEHRRIITQLCDLREDEQGQIRYGYMCSMVLGIGSICYNMAHPYENLTSLLYYHKVMELYNEIAKYPDFHGRQKVWLDILKSMPEGFEEFYFDIESWNVPNFNTLTTKQVNDFLEYLKTEQFNQDMIKLMMSEESFGKIS